MTKDRVKKLFDRMRRELDDLQADIMEGIEAEIPCEVPMGSTFAQASAPKPKLSSEEENTVIAVLVEPLTADEISKRVGWRNSRTNRVLDAMVWNERIAFRDGKFFLV